MAITYRHVAGKIGDICAALRSETDTDVPPLNAIIINDTSRLPSYGVDFYLSTYLGMRSRDMSRLSDAARDAYAGQIMQQVFDYSGWKEVANHLGIRITEVLEKVKVPDLDEAIDLTDSRDFASGPESEAHQKLKEWVAARFELFRKYGSFEPGDTEYPLSSGDRLDVYFSNGTSRLAVEIKSRDAPEAEVKRGIYQCVKYRATLRAMQTAAFVPPNAQAVLVLDRNPSEIVARLAHLLLVDIVTVIPGRI